MQGPKPWSFFIRRRTGQAPLPVLLVPAHPPALRAHCARGYTGDDVVTVQQRLKELGYYTGSIDGVYGSGSIAAATAFQKNNGLKVDGLTGQSTYAALFFQLGRGSWFFRAPALPAPAVLPARMSS